MGLPYSDKVLDHFMNPRNAGEMENADATATEGSPACGDQIKLFLKVNPVTRVIEDIKFKSYGCASNIATASIITEMAKGKTLEEAKAINWQTASENLGGLPAVKIHCAVLAVDAVRSAIDNYEQEHGLIREKAPTDEKRIRERLKHVINPLTGLDVMQVNFIRSIEITDGIINVHVNMGKEHQFSGNILEEIKERLEPLWDVKEVRVIFKNEG
ncbi:MAG: iron-sulfur cluster assembly scaffold protein [bacterium]|nr:iron-sulfur cluster assembly scaffold protein [bacterium]